MRTSLAMSQGLVHLTELVDRFRTAVQPNMVTILVVTALSGVGILIALIYLRGKKVVRDFKVVEEESKHHSEFGPMLKQIEKQFKDKLGDMVLDEFDIDAEFMGSGVKLKLRPREALSIRSTS